MSDTPTKRPAKKAAATKRVARPREDVERAIASEEVRARAELTEEPKADSPIPAAPADDEVFVIEPVIERYRYMFAGGRIMDVTSPYRSDSNDRGKVLVEAQRRWGGKKDDWRIEGSTRLTIEE